MRVIDDEQACISQVYRIYYPVTGISRDIRIFVFIKFKMIPRLKNHAVMRSKLIVHMDPSNNEGDFVPKDIGNIAYLICFYLGLGNLLPWNAFITASSYYTDRFCGIQYDYHICLL